MKTLFCKKHIDYTHIIWNQERNQNMCDKPAIAKYCKGIGRTGYREQKQLSLEQYSALFVQVWSHYHHY